MNDFTLDDVIDLQDFDDDDIDFLTSIFELEGDDD